MYGKHYGGRKIAYEKEILDFSYLGGQRLKGFSTFIFWGTPFDNAI